MLNKELQAVLLLTNFSWCRLTCCIGPLQGVGLVIDIIACNLAEKSIVTNYK